MNMDYLAKNPDLVEIARKHSREQVRKYKEEQRAKKKVPAAGKR